MSSEEAAEFAIQADTSMLRMRPNRSREAIELWDRGELSGASMLRENGFDPKADAMKGGERRSWLARKVAQGSTTPELVAEALRLLGVDVNPQTPEEVEIPTEDESEEPSEARPVRSLLRHPERGTPKDSTTGPDAASLLAASEVIVFRALERAGNRLKAKLGADCPKGIPASELYLSVPGPMAINTVNDLLLDAWSCTDRFCGEADPIALAEILDGYARTIITMRVPHDREILHLRLRPLLQPVLAAV